MPTPSLLLPSAATAPRCASRPSAVNACCRMVCEDAASLDATKPAPQESWSNRSSTSETGRARRASGRTSDSAPGCATDTSFWVHLGHSSIIHYTSDAPATSRPAFQETDSLQSGLDALYVYLYNKIVFLCSPPLESTNTKTGRSIRQEIDVKPGKKAPGKNFVVAR
jgi:hypothetical protein